MKICHLSNVHPLNDNRIFYKECQSLAEAGYDVSVIIVHDKDETINGVKVIGLAKAANRFQRFFISTFKLLRYALEQKARIYHFHDPELIPVGIVLKLFGKKVICDVHENLPQQVLNKNWLGPMWLRRTVSLGVIAAEKLCKLVFDTIIVARPDIAKHWGPSKVTIVMNSASLGMIDSTPQADVEKEKPVVIYAGGLTRIRGIKELIEAMEIVGDKAELWLLGSWHDEGFHIECKEMTGWRYVEYLGYRTVEEVFELMKKSDIGIITFLPGPNHLTTIPTKPFEYMACRLPVIMSDFEYWHTIFGDAVTYVDPASPEEIAEKIVLLLEDNDLASQLVAAGRKLVEEGYSWEVEQEKLLDVYRALEQ